MPTVLTPDVLTAPSARTLVTGPRARCHEVFLLWCELTAADPGEFDLTDVSSFLSRPEVPVLADAPDAVLRDAATAVRRGRSLPLERWLAALRVVRPTRHEHRS